MTTATGTRREPSGRRRAHVELSRYRDEDGATRELLARPGAAGTVLVVDRDLMSRGDERLVAHLEADEPPGNASMVARAFLEAEPGERRCRPLEDADTCCPPFPESLEEAPSEHQPKPAVATGT